MLSLACIHHLSYLIVSRDHDNTSVHYACIGSGFLVTMATDTQGIGEWITGLIQQGLLVVNRWDAMQAIVAPFDQK